MCIGVLPWGKFVHVLAAIMCSAGKIGHFVAKSGQKFTHPKAFL